MTSLGSSQETRIRTENAVFVCLWTEIPKLIQLTLERCRFELWGPLICRFFSVDPLSLTDPPFKPTLFKTQLAVGNPHTQRADLSYIQVFDYVGSQRP